MINRKVVSAVYINDNAMDNYIYFPINIIIYFYVIQINYIRECRLQANTHIHVHIHTRAQTDTHTHTHRNVFVQFIKFVRYFNVMTVTNIYIYIDRCFKAIINLIFLII